jgi:hypothetical protein
MITTLVQFHFPVPITRDEAQEIFLEVAPKFHEIPGLIRKYFLLGEDDRTTGGVYLWKSRSDAESFYTDDFKMWIRDRYGSQPSITYFESPVIVDNLANEIIRL